MKTYVLFPAVLLAAAISGSTALAQENAAATTGSTAVSSAPAGPITVNGVVYVDKLPTATSLLKDAETEGLTIARMEQSSDRMVVVYQYPNGTTRAFAYTTSVSGTAVAPVATVAAQPATRASTATYTVISEPPAGTTVVYEQPATVVYTQPSTVYYEPRYVRYYDPVWDGWAPLAIGLGLGLSWNHGYHGGYHGGGHGGWHH